LIDIEGIDGSGKGTQARILCDRLQANGVTSRLISFPRYDATFFGHAIGEFLNGRFGTLDEVHPFLVSLLFAGDRFESKKHLHDAMATNDVVVLDRYVPSNVAHQAAKLDSPGREELAGRIQTLEFEINGLPKADLVLLLDLPVSTAQELIARKAQRSYTSRPADLQEADGRYLQRVRDMYLDLARAEPHWHVIPCTSHDGLRSIEEIGDQIWGICQPTIRNHGTVRTVTDEGSSRVR
jgi:dTMP kinase